MTRRSSTVAAEHPPPETCSCSSCPIEHGYPSVWALITKRASALIGTGFACTAADGMSAFVVLTAANNKHLFLLFSRFLTSPLISAAFVNNDAFHRAGPGLKGLRRCWRLVREQVNSCLAALNTSSESRPGDGVSAGGAEHLAAHTRPAQVAFMSETND